MKRNAVLFTIVLSSLILVYAQDNKPMEMVGWICHSTCVTESAGHATCDASCSDKSGAAVFVGDDGKVSAISNPDMVKGKMGQKVKVRCQMNKDQDAMEILEVIQANAG